MSIVSPHFSEFSLRLLPGFGFCGAANVLMWGASGRRTRWGTGWEVVDENLYMHAARRDNFRFVVKIVPGESTEATVAVLFPRMNSKGALSIVC